MIECSSSSDYISSIQSRKKKLFDKFPTDYSNEVQFNSCILLVFNMVID